MGKNLGRPDSLARRPVKPVRPRDGSVVPNQLTIDMPVPTLSKTPRIEVVDALRGFAVMAILLVHNLEHFIFPVYPDAALQPVEWYHYIAALIHPGHTLPDLGVGQMYQEVATYTQEGNLLEFLWKNESLWHRLTWLHAPTA